MVWRHPVPEIYDVIVEEPSEPVITVAFQHTQFDLPHPCAHCQTSVTEGIVNANLDPSPVICMECYRSFMAEPEGA